jgi:hypothetical protein
VRVYGLVVVRGEGESDPPTFHRGYGAGGAVSVRRLPWAGPGGQACYLTSDGSDASSALWRLADEMESVQLGIGRELLGFARRTLTETAPSDGELRGVVAQLCRALSDALRVADSRGALLGLPVNGDQGTPADKGAR